MEDSCYLCGKNCEQVTEYLRTMLSECQGKSFEGLYYGPFQHCLNSMKSLMYLNRRIEQRKDKLSTIRKRISGLEAELEGTDPKSKKHQSIQTELKRYRPQVDSVQREIGEIQIEIDRKQRIVDEFLDVKLESYQTKSGYIIKLCPVCLSLVKDSIHHGRTIEDQ